ncbi:hypothetical protein TNCV_4047181 [Trichonephila clavipes]|nr:hypothetical protein TNCV_4047181 [Trichonephila clavipes]
MPTSAIKDLFKKWEAVRAMVLEWHPNQADVSRLECIGGIEFPCCQLNYRLPKWEAKTRHGVGFVLALLKTLVEDLKQQTAYQNSTIDTLSGFKSGDRAGHSIHFKPRPLRYSSTIIAR